MSSPSSGSWVSAGGWTSGSGLVYFAASSSSIRASRSASSTRFRKWTVLDVTEQEAPAAPSEEDGQDAPDPGSGFDEDTLMMLLLMMNMGNTDTAEPPSTALTPDGNLTLVDDYDEAHAASPPIRAAMICSMPWAEKVIFPSSPMLTPSGRTTFVPRVTPSGRAGLPSSRYKELCQKYIQQENTEIHEMVRARNMTPDQLAEVLKALQGGLIPFPAAVRTPSGRTGLPSSEAAPAVSSVSAGAVSTVSVSVAPLVGAGAPSAAKQTAERFPIIRTPARRPAIMLLIFMLFILLDLRSIVVTASQRIRRARPRHSGREKEAAGRTSVIKDLADRKAAAARKPPEMKREQKAPGMDMGR